MSSSHALSRLVYVRLVFSILLPLLELYRTMGPVLWLLFCSCPGLDHQVVIPEGSTDQRVTQTSGNDGWMPLPSLGGASGAAAEHPPPVWGVLFSFPFSF